MKHYLPLNMPRPIQATESKDGALLMIQGKRVARILDHWRIRDEWWRSEIHREYYLLELENGDSWTGFKDLISGEWYAQRV